MAELLVNEQETAPQVSGVARAMRVVYVIGAALLVLGVAMQVFLAGAALLVSGTYIDTHRTLAHLVELVSMVIIVVGFFTKFPARVQGLGVLFLLLMFMQYVFLYAVPALGIPVLRALHAANALLMFWAALALTQRTWPLTFGRE